MKKIIKKLTLIAAISTLLINFNINQTFAGPKIIEDSSGAPTGTIEPKPGSLEEQEANNAAMEDLVEDIENEKPTGMAAGAAGVGESIEDSANEAAAESAAANPNPVMDELMSEEEEAAAAAELNSKSLRNAQFDVGEVLTLGNGQQEQKYLYTTGKSPIVNFILEVIDFAITIMGSIAMILFIIAGFMFMFAQGNQQKLDEAKDIIKYAAIGLIVALLSYIITIFVQSIFVSA